VTLSYGLGFGMVLVLILVPAVLYMGHDLSRMGGALRRLLRLPARGRGRGVGVLGLSAGTLVALWAVPTMFWQSIYGTVWGPLATILPDAGTAAVLGVFLLGTAAILVTIYLTAALALHRRVAT
jgi:hypothetical protein